MVDLQNVNTPTNSNPQVRLKKVKRPVNRMMPQAPATGSGNIQQNQQPFTPNQKAGNTAQFGEAYETNQPKSTTQNPFVQQAVPDTAAASNQSGNIYEAPSLSSQPAADNDAFNLDSFLDETDNLPSLNRQPVDYNNGQNPQFIEEEDLDDSSYGSDLPPYLTKKVLALIAAVVFFMGIVTAKLIFTESKIVSEGLRGVVPNAEVPMGRARCGVAERTQGCVLYLMNPQRQDLSARDFYDLASQLTGRQRFVIETGNMRYSNTKIRPGEIVQLNIPPL